MKYNPDRPEAYDLANLPMRTAQSYWEIIKKLFAATSKTARAVITKSTGVSRLPLCAASRAFLHPTYFPLDPFHLFYENGTAFIWDIWTISSSETEIIHLPANKARAFGSLVAKAMVSLPPSFCGPIRDPHLKCQSQYKVYEWMALLHWYIIPIGIELGFNSLVLQNFSLFAEAVEFAMTISERTEKELEGLRSLIIKFLTGFEKLYVDGDPEKISRMCLCIFQLIHVPTHIKWNGSIRLGSQATVERSIGEMGHKIHSKKAPFANLANIIFERELVKILLLYLPALDINANASKEMKKNDRNLIQKRKITKREGQNEQVICELDAINAWLKEANVKEKFVKWFEAKNTHAQASSTTSTPPGSNTPNILNHTFGEANSFYKVELTNKTYILVVYTPLIDVQPVLRTQIRGKWESPTTLKVIEASQILDLVGIWSAEASKNIYVLRKHPGLAMLSAVESGKGDEGNDTDDSDSDEE
ncbi:uncharacterized protein LACBIDRAFT_299510 [Laccaria bicolor S238N-H82]|uniref:Predicted protein n=1 Tax=Laccaria bicolor (strain S238N-H82 / ATCC MYA-4686) TaxID=486041 RepID=B0E3P7_LACBS|nr:uncharacterized protein LACBIDRAFT_299510 [Laccaria bicolor S238N-H82]EDQ98531.1 predicted protein [Laccaria bicolor S238N-H82]|eukprot:XP_001890816.1 predicted protein [Laccaria bicolor S238N-H82]